ncbi:MAG TPA: type 1 glutamine amidotransferase [Candidatus Krumholzibacteria bacterium]|nr:type 1 glutamine amidotransferase [Candidatus Krumholzibacteria bacterium]
MRIHCLQHVPFESPGYIGNWCDARGHDLVVTRLYADEPVPAPSDVEALVVMGGPMGVHDDADYAWMKGEKQLIGSVLEAEKRVFGVCLGAQMIAHVSGARVYRNRFQEIGWFPVEATREGVSRLELPRSFATFHWHGDTFQLPAGAVNLVRTDACEHQMFMVGERVVGIQFHLEVTAADVASMCAHGGHDLPEGPYVQTVEKMRSFTDEYESSHQLMVTLLDRWMGEHAE